MVSTSVDGVLDAILLVDRAGFGDGPVIAAESGGDPLIQAGARQQVAGDLVDHETVERLVAVEGGDDPVAPGPHGAGEVVLKAVGVGVAGAVEPVHRHSLAVMRRSQQAIDQGLVGVGTGVGEKRVDLLRRGRQPDQIEREPADQGGPLGLRRRREALGLEPGQHEPIDRVYNPGGVSYRWRARAVAPAQRPSACSIAPLDRSTS